MGDQRKKISRRLFLGGLAVSVAGSVAVPWWMSRHRSETNTPQTVRRSRYKSRNIEDTSGYVAVTTLLVPWAPNASLEEVGNAWRRIGTRHIEGVSQTLAVEKVPHDRMKLLLVKAMLCNYDAEPRRAYRVLEEMRSALQDDDALAQEWLYTVIYYQAVTALRCGETENCVQCRGPCSCILPIVQAAIHANPSGSRLAIRHFAEYLAEFPDDFEVQWLLNVAHMTLAEYPDKIDAKNRISIDPYLTDDFAIGAFQDISAAVGVDRFNMSGGAIMDDFDNDGLLDLVVTSTDATQSMAFYHNKGDGTFDDWTERAGLSKQIGGALNCVQADYNNDGNLDLFVVRGAWLPYPVRPSLLRNNGDGTFTDVTAEAGLLDPVNSPCAIWADYDNDGLLDLFVCCERQPNRLYRNRGDGTFEEVATKAGLRWDGRCAKGAAWIDYDNDGYPDLFLCNSGQAPSQLYHNNGDGTFTEVTEPMGIKGPTVGFSCWAWDYDNDGWLDLFATSYERTLTDVIRGLQGRPHGGKDSNKLYRNVQGKGFQDVTAEAGLDMVFATMGSNCGDFDNDGYLDFYLGTGDPKLGMLVPNRLFKNVGGKRFVEITASSGTGHLQKGHGVACGDWRRSGNLDIFIEMGGVTNGDRYHNLLFRNPGQGNNWLTVKLIGKKTNRSAIGARLKVVTTAEKPLTIHRHISSGSSFGGNPLQQTIGLGKAKAVATLEIHWPTSRTTQVFREVAVDQAIEVTEFAADYRKLNWKRLSAPGD